MNYLAPLDILNEETAKIEQLPMTKETLIENIIIECPDDIKEIFQEFLLNNKNLLAVDTDDLGKSKLLAHEIKIDENVKPIKQRMYRLSKEQMTVLKGEKINLLKNNLIKPSQLAWPSPVLLLPKRMVNGGCASTIEN